MHKTFVFKLHMFSLVVRNFADHIYVILGSKSCVHCSVSMLAMLVQVFTFWSLLVMACTIIVSKFFCKRLHKSHGAYTMSMPLKILSE